MAEQPDDPTSRTLLAELESGDASRRKSAAEALAELGTASEAVASALKSVAAQDPNKFVRQAAQEALIKLGLEVPPLSSTLPTPSKPELTRDQKIIYISQGLVGWFVINGLLWLVVRYSSNGTADYIFLNLLILPANLIVLIVLAFTRRWVALGILLAFSANFLVAMSLGLAVQAWCGIPFVVQ